MANLTGSWVDDLKKTGEDMFGTGTGVYPQEPMSIDDQINQMPNAEKLSGGERWLYNRLPGFSESSIGKVLSSFSESPAGKILGKLDILAEGFERGLGVIAQYRDMQPGDDFRLKDAWEAGSLFYDVAQLPRLSTDENGNMGIHIDTALPGAYALTEARKLMQSGKTLEEVRDTLYSNLGALALRSQLNDTLGHIVLDPLNWMLGAVKPIEKLHAIRNLALTGKMDIELVKGLSAEAKAAGALDDVAKYSAVIAKAEKEGKALTKLDKFAIMITGGTPYTQDVTKLTKAQGWLAKVNPFALTPQARAHELLDIVTSNVGEYLIRPNWTKDPEEFINAVANAAKGGIGDQWGHLAATTQGRTVQGILSNSDAAVKSLGLEWKTYEGERTLLNTLTNFLPGMDEGDLYKLAKENPEFLYKKILAAAELPGAEMLKVETQSGKLSQKIIEQVGKMDASVPLTKENFYVKAMATVEDVAAQQAIVQFGIKEKGVITKWSDALKAWEGAAFLKINPANAARNVINNDVTMIARGVYGTMSEKAINQFWEGKWMPPQMKRAFSLGLDTEIDADLATKRIMEVVEGKGGGLLKKIKGIASSVETPISKYSSKMEASASLRASTNGWIEFHNKYWNAKTGFTSISKSLDPQVLDEMEKVAPGIAETLDKVAQSAGADPDKFAKLLQSNLEHNIASVFEDASDNLGYKIDDVLGTELSHTIREGLPDAMQKGNVREFVDGVKMQMEQHVDDLFNKHVENLPGIIAAQVQAGGPLQYHRIFGKAVDEFWGGNVEHAIRMSSINELMDSASVSGNYEKVSKLWEKIFQDSESHFGRVWKKFDAYQDGLKNGAKAAGVKYPQEVTQSFTDMRKGWEEVFKFRNTEYRKLFDAKLGGKDYAKTLDQLKSEIDVMYKGMASKEDELYQHIDDLMSESLDSFSGTMYRNYRDQASKLRLADRQKTIDFYKKIGDAPKDEAPALWTQYWQDRTTGMEQLRQLELRGSAALQGDASSIAMFSQKAETEAGTVYDLANQFGIPSATKGGARNDRRILNTVNKYLPEGTEKFKSVNDIPMEIAQKAFETRVQEKAAQLGKGVEKSFIPDAEKIFKDPLPLETGLSEMNYGRSYASLEALKDSAVSRASKKSALLQDLSPEIQGKVNNWMGQVNDEMSSFRAGAVQYSQFRRDSALLDYNRRTNFDNWVGHMAPFGFWTTHSVVNWAVHSIDRPAMLTSFFRAKKLFETAGLADQNIPQRLKGKIRVDLPFTPKWMGQQFADPLQTLLPFDSWMQPWEQAQSSKFSLEGKAKTTLDQMLEANKISQNDYQQAIQSKSGPAWEQAYAAAQEGGDNYNAMDFVNMTMTPHAPLMWAYNAATGNKQDIGPFTPMSRSVKNFATMMGVDDWSNSPYNVEGKLRKSMGLPAYDKWDDYRVGREISNIAADGQHDMNEVNEAMQTAALVESGKMTSADAVKNNPLYAEATKRANQEYAGGWLGTAASLLGINIKMFPEGEQKQRELADKFAMAYDEYDKGNVQALTDFFDQHPEYESRLALFKSPEERLKTFMVDNIWQRWNDLPKVNQDEIKDQLGPDFANSFVNKETRNYDSVTPLQMQVWLKLMGGKPVGSLSATEDVMIELNRLKLTDPETAWRVQTFYDMRKDYPDFYRLQNEYYGMKETDRPKFLQANPQLKQYWDARRSWMTKNPDLVRFLTDDPKQLKKYENVKRKAEIATPTADEIRSKISQPTAELLSEWYNGEQLPASVQIYINNLADSYGIDTRTMLGILTGQ